MAMRIVLLFLPTWSTDRMRRGPGGVRPTAQSPLVTALPDHGRRVVVAADAVARQLGIAPGVGMAAATRDSGHLAKLLRQRIETVEPGDTPYAVRDYFRVETATGGR